MEYYPESPVPVVAINRPGSDCPGGAAGLSGTESVYENRPGVNIIAANHEGFYPAANLLARAREITDTGYCPAGGDCGLEY